MTIDIHIRPSVLWVSKQRVPVKCEMKRETERNETKYTETKRNLPKRNEIETKRNKSKRN